MKLKNKYVRVGSFIGDPNCVILSVAGQSFKIAQSIPGDKANAKWFAKELRKAIKNLVRTECTK